LQGFSEAGFLVGSPAFRVHVRVEFECRGMAAEDEGLSENQKRIVHTDAVEGNAGGKEGLEEGEPVEEGVGAAGNEGEPAVGFAADQPAKAATGRWAAEFDDLLASRIEKHGCFSASTDQGEWSGLRAFKEWPQTLRKRAAEFRAFAEDCV
jgi:hypothetical protein